MKSTCLRWVFGLLLAVLLSVQPSQAQLPGASPATLGTANNYMPLARGFAAVGLNPAGLGLPGNEGLTLALFPLMVSQSLDPLTFSDFVDYEGVLVPANVKEDWLQQIASAGGQTGAGTVELTEFSLSYNNFGVQLSTLVSGRANLTDAAAELLLFGNSGRTGEPGDFELQGSGLTGYAVTTLGVSAAFGIARRWVPGVQQGLSVGATIKQSWGHALAFAKDGGTMAQSDPLSLDVDFPVIHSRDNGSKWSTGTGLGIDVGVAWERGPWKASAVVENLLNNFEWDLAELAYRPGQALFDGATNTSDFDEQPATEAPPALRDEVTKLTFKPVIGLGGAYQAQDNLTLTAELRQRAGDGLDTGPKSHIGVGVEYFPTPRVPLRAGIAAITDGIQVGAGLGVILGPVHLGLGGMYQTGDVGNGIAGTFGLSFGGG